MPPLVYITSDIVPQVHDFMVGTSILAEVAVCSWVLTEVGFRT